MSAQPTPHRGDAVHVTLHVWRIRSRAVPRALWRMVHDRGSLRRTPGVRFAKLLATARGFGPGQADPTRWAAVVAWESAAASAGFDATRPARAWGALARSYCRIDCRPITVRGRWAGRNPFPTAAPRAGDDAPVLAITRARLRAARAVAFWRASAPVASAAGRAPGLLAAFGVGEAPVGWQGTVTLWRRAHDLAEFAYRQPDHLRAIERTPIERWYAEDLFARFEVLQITGDRDAIGWADEGTVQ